MEEVLLKSERRQTRAEIASYLRTVADRLEDGGALSLSAGSDSIDLDVPAEPTFEVKVEREHESSGTELSAEFELEWMEGESGEAESSSLEIE
jgi:amphi-Trp domain-containing protein